MGSRRFGRECALHILYSMDVCRLGPEEARTAYWKWKKVSQPVKDFACRLVEGTREHLGEIDGHIKKVAQLSLIHI